MLTAGSTIGPYRIEREIGRGGMGVIFLAQDTRLGRAAAIKALPEEVASDPERMSRFEREAKSLASLSHSNVAGIYGLEESEGRRYLALEYVEGESLAERLARGPLSVQDAIEIGVQVAAGIEAAHEAGIIHRDLKPGNVVITASDVAKVLDFGLAKGRVAEGPSAASPTAGPTGAGADSPTPHSPTIANSPTLAHSPTLQTPATMPGVILGTAAYLSPEQARGKVVDRRTDIWSFGCLLYECLTGKQAFAGETVSDTIAKILERDVDWSPLPAATPPALRALLARCLEKDARRRLRDIGDARLTLEELKAGHSTAALAAVGAAQAGDSGVIDPGAIKAAIAKGKRGRMLLALGAFAAGAVAAAVIVVLLARGGLSSGGGPVGPARLSLVLPEDLQLQNISVSRDGRTIVVQGAPRDLRTGEERVARLYVRPMDGDQFQPLAGTEYASRVAIFPDGKWVCFLQRVSERSRQLRLMKMPLDGSAPATQLSLWDDSWTGTLALLESGDVLATVAPGNSYVRIPAGGGAASAPVSFKTEGSGTEAALSHALPGDRGVFFVASSYAGNVYQQGVGVLDLKSGKSRILLSDAGSPRYSRTGHLLFSRHDAIFAVPFDLAKLEVTGKPTAIVNGLRIANAWMNGNFGVTASGMVFFPPGGFVGKDRHLVAVDSEGRVTEWSAARLPFEVNAVVSPDGDRALSVVATAGALYEIWLSERGGTSARRFIARDGADVGLAIWSPDGTKIAYTQSARTSDDGVYVMPLDGSSPPRRLVAYRGEARLFPASWTRDGSRLLLTRVEKGAVRAVSAPTSPSGESLPEPTDLFPQSSGLRGSPVLSPDNGLLAYPSDESGRMQIHVQGWNGVAPVGESVPTGIFDAQFSMWSRDGRRLLALDPAGRCMESLITRAPRLSASAPRVLWNTRDLKLSQQVYSMLPDGRVLAIQQGEAEDEVRYIEMILGFPRMLKERLARAGAR